MTVALDVKGSMEAKDDAVEGNKMTSPSKRMVAVELWYWLPSKASVSNLQMHA